MTGEYSLGQWSLDDAIAAKNGRTVSLCIPCRDEAITVGDIVGMARRDLVGEGGLVDEIIVIERGSIVQRGHFDDLRQGGRFKELVHG